MKTLEPLPELITGVGHIFEKEENLARVIYYLNFEKPAIDMVRFKGSMTVCDKTMTFVPTIIYTLQLQGGRKLDFYANGVALANYNIQIQPIGVLY
jgi:hypothetical protein